MTGPSPCRIAEETAADHPAIRTLLGDVFGGSADADLVDGLRAGGDLIAGLVARHDEVIAGYAGFCRLTLAGAEHASLAALAPLAVAAGCRGRGVGALLVRAGIARLGEAGFAGVFVLGDPAYYGRFGFDSARAARFAVPWPGPAFQVLWLGADTHVPGGRLDYPAAFAAFT